MARGVKGLGMGIVGGLSGIVTKPIEGAKQQGGIGFVKGVGKVREDASTPPSTKYSLTFRVSLEQ